MATRKAARPPHRCADPQVLIVVLVALCLTFATCDATATSDAEDGGVAAAAGAACPATSPPDDGGAFPTVHLRAANVSVAYQEVPESPYRLKQSKQVKASAICRLASKVGVPVILGVFANKDSPIEGHFLKEALPFTEPSPRRRRLLMAVAIGQGAFAEAQKHRGRLHTVLFDNGPGYALRWCLPHSDLHNVEISPSVPSVKAFVENLLYYLEEPEVTRGTRSSAEKEGNAKEKMEEMAPPRTPGSAGGGTTCGRGAGPTGWRREIRTRPYTSIDRVANLDPQDFLQKYVLLGRPVVVTDATKTWTALGKWDINWVERKIRPRPGTEDKPRTAGQWTIQSKKESSMLRKDYGIPYFMRFDNVSDVSEDDDAIILPPRTPSLQTEMLYFGPKKTNGLFAHLDTDCGST